MQIETIESFKEYLIYTESLNSLGNQITLFRGQCDDNSLLPSIARSNPKLNTTRIEVEMLLEFRRRSHLLLNKDIINDWDLLVYAQHYGLKTRLLDWTSNPLIALWFACKNEFMLEKNAFIYILKGDESMLVDVNKDLSPFKGNKTKILRPVLNNDRIVAQSGWFTAHKYSDKTNSFVGLEKNVEVKKKIIKLIIPASGKIEILKKLAAFGTNNRTIFPDIHGLCAHMNWIYRDKLK
ncbi:FRG domain-containing protein [Mucilaginibacter sp. UR6-1]|uniref:FRG domain-containing protein n=1 Tax=Mucilaginibacter sp. UR6-1 TaxID=1435643 RepID=UPI001E2E65A5|nr:FRG domain-containing protein [Mucilaginibacter sp. UR6-1]MCC8408517.1 FRG domain-containing protein [Mucilaginibacter sp. UR6-1]